MAKVLLERPPQTDDELYCVNPNFGWLLGNPKAPTYDSGEVTSDEGYTGE